MSAKRSGAGRVAAASALIDQMMAAREQRRAQEAARAAERAQAMARFEAEERALAVARRELDDERLKRDAARKRLEAEAAALEAEKARVVENERIEQETRARAAEEDRRLDEEAAAERRRLDEEERARRVARDQLAAESERLEAAQRVLAEAAAREFERAAVLERTEQEMAAQSRRNEAARAQAVEARRVELEEIDHRLEERASAERQGLPPPVMSNGVRRKSRLEVAATVLVENSGEVIALPLLNASLTGGLIGTDGHQLKTMRVGGMMLLTLVSNDDAKQQVDVVARVVRQTEDSIAVDWSQQEEESAHAVARLLEDTSEPSEERAIDVQEQREEIEEIVGNLEAKEVDQRRARGLPPIVEVPAEVRRKPRLELAASVLVDHDGAQVELALLNVSLTGALVRTHGTHLTKLRVGALLLLTLTSSDVEHAPVDLMARVVRHEGDATAVDWSQDRAAELGVARLLDALARER